MTLSIADLFFAFLRLGITAFGGPTMVSHIRELSVRNKKWLDEATFINGVALCQTIPGATAIQVAGYVGLMKRGLIGALATFVGFGLPAFLFMVLLSWLYVLFGTLPITLSLFQGLQVLVVAIVANATYTFARATLKSHHDIIVALASAVAFGSGLSPFLVILGAAATGLVMFRLKPHENSSTEENKREQHFTAVIFLIISALFIIIFLFLFNKRLFDLTTVMMKIDLFAFGGGYASLPLMLQEIVNVRGWMDSKTFMDGIALGQVTPGPIVITAAFVGFLSSGLVGAIVATVGIFTPSFILLTLGSAVFKRLQASITFQRSVKGIFASFVGLLLYTTAKFALAIPWDVTRLFIFLAAAVALFKKVDTLYVV